LKQRRVRFTFIAQQHVEHEKAWWLENRDHIDALAEELEQALKIVATLPGVGTPYATSPVAGVRRVCAYDDVILKVNVRSPRWFARNVCRLCDGTVRGRLACTICSSANVSVGPIARQPDPA
jgi:hypothetical protein